MASISPTVLPGNAPGAVAAPAAPSTGAVLAPGAGRHGNPRKIRASGHRGCDARHTGGHRAICVRRPMRRPNGTPVATRGRAALHGLGAVTSDEELNETTATKSTRLRRSIDEAGCCHGPG